MGTFGDRPPLEVTSPANPRVKWLLDLRKRRTRDKERLTLVEGFEEISLALDAGVTPDHVFYCPGLVRDPGRLALAERAARHGAQVVVLGDSAFAKASFRESPDGWLAVVPEPGHRLSELEIGPRPLLLVCEGIEKPGNLGAMLRTAEAAGVDAVIAAAPVADWGNPNVIRASKGTVFAVPVATAGSDEVLTWLRAKGVTVVVATPDTDVLVTEVDLTGPVAVVVGAEHEGLSRGWLDGADHAARLPMVGHVNSLNVATSAALVVYEAVRQRAAGH